MANTKKLSKPERKAARRKARRGYQEIYRGLSQAEKDAFSKGDVRSLKIFAASLKAKAEKPAT